MTWSIEIGLADDGTMRWRTNTKTWAGWSNMFYNPPDPFNPADLEEYSPSAP